MAEETTKKTEQVPGTNGKPGNGNGRSLLGIDPEAIKAKAAETSKQSKSRPRPTSTNRSFASSMTKRPAAAPSAY